MVRVLSVASMLPASLGIQDKESEETCDVCHTPVCVRDRIVEYPEYLPVSICRTFFEKNYAMVKDCTNIVIDPIVTVQSVWIARCPHA